MVKFSTLLQNDEILDRSKLKAFAGDKINVNEKLNSVLGQVENIVGKGENAGYQHFLLFPQCFQNPSITLGSLKVRLCGKGLNHLALLPHFSKQYNID